MAFAFGLQVKLLETLQRPRGFALSCLMAVAVITACDDGDIPTPTLEPTASPAREPTPTPIRTARPGAAGLDDPLYPGLGNGGYDVSRYTVTLDIDVEANEISGRTQIEADATQDLSSFNLDLRGLTVTQVTVGWPPSRPLSHRIRADNRARCADPCRNDLQCHGLLRGSAFDQLCAWNKSPNRLDKLRDRDNRVRRTLGGVALAPGQ